jgi:thioredoxin 1
MLAFKQLDEFSFYAALAQSPGASLVLFDSPECGACRTLKQQLPALLGAAVQQLYRVDVGESTGLAREYEVFYLPALFLFVDGHFHAPVQSVLTAPALRAAIESVMRQPAQEAP